MTDVIPIAQTVDALERRLAAAESKLARLIPFGNQLATIAYNIKQMEKMSDSDRRCLHAAQAGWDKARGSGV